MLMSFMRPTHTPSFGFIDALGNWEWEMLVFLPSVWSWHYFCYHEGAWHVVADGAQPVLSYVMVDECRLNLLLVSDNFGRNVKSNKNVCGMNQPQFCEKRESKIADQSAAGVTTKQNVMSPLCCVSLDWSVLVEFFSIGHVELIVQIEALSYPEASVQKAVEWTLWVLLCFKMVAYGKPWKREERVTHWRRSESEILPESWVMNP